MLDKIDTSHSNLRKDTDKFSSSFLTATKAHLDDSEDEISDFKPLVQKI